MNTFKNWIWGKKEAEKVTMSWKHKLRISGLTDPEKWLKQAYESFENPDILQHALYASSRKALGILDLEADAYDISFDQSVLMLRYDGLTSMRMNRNNI